MERLFLECTIRAALLVAGTKIVLYAVRVKPPALRHRVWTGVLVLMLVLPAWTAWGPKLSLRVLPPAPGVTANVTTPASGTALTTSTASPAVPTREAALLGIYLIGLCLFLARLATGTVRARRLAGKAVVDDGVRTSRFCTAPITIGFFHPVVILPERWRAWSQAQFDAILTHEGEHARRRDPLVQWLALLNRAIFWFHPVSWWLERNLSALAEQACDDAVLARGHNPRTYAEYLIDVARSMSHSGTRVNLAGMWMPGTFLPQRIRKIVQARPALRISRTRMACAVALCVMTCTASAAGKLDHAPQTSTARPTMERNTAPAAQPSAKFVLGDLMIQGNVQDVSFRERIMQAWKNREYGDVNTLTHAVIIAVQRDFQDRGFFRVVVSAVRSQLQGIVTLDGKEPVLITLSVDSGDQYYIGSLNVYSSEPPMAIPPPEVVQNLFHLKRGDLYDARELRGGLARLKEWYAAHNPANARGMHESPQFQIDDTHHTINVTIRVYTDGGLGPLHK